MILEQKKKKKKIVYTPETSALHNINGVWGGLNYKGVFSWCDMVDNPRQAFSQQDLFAWKEKKIFPVILPECTNDRLLS